MNTPLPDGAVLIDLQPSPPADKIESALHKGLSYLEQHQFPHGEFCCFQSGDDPMLGWTHQVNMLFPTMLICQSLLYLPQTEQVKRLAIKAGWFLRHHMNRCGAWGHYTWMHTFSDVIPFDVDDTCCIGATLQSLGIDYPAHTTQRLVLANRNSQGLFYTWFTVHGTWVPLRRYWQLALREFLAPIKGYFFWKKMECSRNDVDAVVNANVLCYFGEIPETKTVVQWLLQIIAEEREDNCDKWYRNTLSVYYFISRCYAKGISSLEPARQQIIERTLAQMHADGAIGASALETALGMCTLMNLGYTGTELDAACRYLLQTQNNAGNWPRWRLYYGGPLKKSGYGSEELTTAFCLQALTRYNGLRHGHKNGAHWLQFPKDPEPFAESEA